MSAPKRSAMYQALNRVINGDGYATDPQYTVTKAVTAAWESAKRQCFIEPMTAHDRGQLIRHKRSTRSIILAMLTDATMDEGRTTSWLDRETKRAQFTECADALQSVLYDIYALADINTPVWTLNPRGVYRMYREDYEASL